MPDGPLRGLYVAEVCVRGDRRAVYRAWHSGITGPGIRGLWLVFDVREGDDGWVCTCGGLAHLALTALRAWKGWLFMYGGGV